MGIWTHLTAHELRKLDSAPDELPDEGFLWLDAQLDEELVWLPKVEKLQNIRLDDLHREDLLNTFHLGHFDIGDGYTILVSAHFQRAPCSTRITA
jgi:magnesium transporter